jgi:hypothetical protein
MKTDLAALRHHAVRASLFDPTTLGRAIDRLGFIQADPIRSPARAQDLILRHRVMNYKVGDLDRSYHRLRLEEDYLYAYGFMPLKTWLLLHPTEKRELTSEEKEVLDVVSGQSRLHPKELQRHLGRGREVNAWGGFSQTSTRILERLHHLGLVRIVGRDQNIKLYGVSGARADIDNAAERLRHVVLLIAKMMAPISKRSLLFTLRHLRSFSADSSHAMVDQLMSEGELASSEVEKTLYLWPKGRLQRTEPEQRVRFLAPFDPLVWDRRRFEHLWGWAYRFEAYTPPSKRKRGYYAMPLLWQSDVVGWVNASVNHGDLSIEPGFVRAEVEAPKRFEQEFEAERERLKVFLTVPAP